IANFTPSETNFPIDSIYRTTPFDNNTMLDKEAASILSVLTPLKKSYESVIRRYELLAIKNKRLNKNKTVWPIAKESLINLKISSYKKPLQLNTYTNQPVSNADPENYQSDLYLYTNKAENTYHQTTPLAHQIKNQHERPIRLPLLAWLEELLPNNQGDEIK
ncbi:21629_t:CDS:2, partial [Racocetra persica]